jgi:hypothetical protein
LSATTGSAKGSAGFSLFSFWGKNEENLADPRSMSVIAILRQQSFGDAANSKAFIDLPDSQK